MAGTLAGLYSYPLPSLLAPPPPFPPMPSILPFPCIKLLDTHQSLTLAHTSHLLWHTPVTHSGTHQSLTLAHTSHSLWYTPVTHSGTHQSLTLACSACMSAPPPPLFTCPPDTSVPSLPTWPACTWPPGRPGSRTTRCPAASAMALTAAWTQMPWPLCRTGPSGCSS